MLLQAFFLRLGGEQCVRVSQPAGNACTPPENVKKGNLRERNKGSHFLFRRIVLYYLMVTCRNHCTDQRARCRPAFDQRGSRAATMGVRWRSGDFLPAWDFCRQQTNGRGVRLFKI